MKYVPRLMEPLLKRTSGLFPAVVLTGPRRAGKTALLRHLFPGAKYWLLEEPDLLARVRADPRAFVEEQKTPVILDEIQNIPELFPYVRARIDAAPRKTNGWLFTGSQDFSLMSGITESMAGRAAILQLLPLSQWESPRVGLLSGGFPEVVARPAAHHVWFSSYIQSYLERDVRAITQIKDLSAFRRFMSLLASRHGQMLNKVDLAAPLGVSVPTISQWISILETTGLVALVPPYFENFGKRLVKTPRLYWLDSGLVCHLLGILGAAELERSPFLGAVWEGHVAAEILKARANAGMRKELYYFRDEQGLEVDFVVPAANASVSLVEAKAGRTFSPGMARPITALMRSMKTPPKNAWVVGRASGPGTTILAPGVKAGALREMLASL